MENENNQFKQALAYLTLNCSFLPDLGLFHGKMGCALFFAIYASKYQNKLYEDFVGDLLDEIYEDIHDDVPFNLESGLCGIGWGVEFLIQNGFVDGNSDEILEDIDRLIMEHDVSRMSDLSFRQGIAGIAFYVTARLSSIRANASSNPFDEVYLANLKDVLLSVKFTEEDEVPPLLVETYLSVLNGAKRVEMKLPLHLDSLLLNLPNDFSSIPLGLEGGIAGILLNHIFDCSNQDELNDICGKIKNGLFIFDEESRAAQYGIGTYIQQLIDCMRDCSWEIHVIHLRSYKTRVIMSERVQNVYHHYIANVKEKGYGIDLQMQSNRYYQNAILLILSYLKKYNNMVFHLNYLQMTGLALTLKKYFPKSKVVATVHYTSWSFDLLGDRERLQNILKNPEVSENYEIYKNIENEKCFMNVCDKIIAIAKHSYKDLLTIHGVYENKLTLIPHGIKDVYIDLSKNEYTQLREKYGFSVKDEILVFVGRIDAVKGIYILIDSFNELVKKYPKLKLLIIGDGLFSNLLPKGYPHWSKCVFTGFVDKTTLYELLSISNIGIIPSLHEEFGYVALEMMMMKLPLIVGRTTGLSEIVIDGKTSYVVPLSSGDKYHTNNISELRKAISSMIENKSLCNTMAKEGRKRFLKMYDLGQFVQRMRSFYESSI